MVSAGLLARLRVQVERYMTQRCDIEREEQIVDRFGAMVRSWRVMASGVRCRVILERRTGTQAAEIGSQEGLREMYRLVVPVGTGLGIAQRVRIGSDVYEIVSVQAMHADAMDEQAAIIKVSE